MKKTKEKYPRCFNCKRTPIFCECGNVYNPQTNKFRDDNLDITITSQGEEVHSDYEN